MARTFNITGTCIPGTHFIADRSEKLGQIADMVAKGHYFTINKPRQYGKSTMMNLLEQRLTEDKDYLALAISFEEIDAPTYKNQELFIATFLDILKEQLEFLNERALLEEFNAQSDGEKSIANLKRLDSFLSRLISHSGRKAVLMIDEVDKACDNQLFLDFLGMLRARYLKRNMGKGYTFHSVILAGVHDVKTLKTKIRPDDKKMYNSPWNIAMDFTIDLSLNTSEIASMLRDYSKERNIKIDYPEISERLFYLTSGYPFLVSYLCKILDEEIQEIQTAKECLPAHLDHAIQLCMAKNNTNFESLIKNLENNSELYELVFKIIMSEQEFSFNLHNPVINLGVIHGVLRKHDAKTSIHNRIYEQLIYNYMSSKLETGIRFGVVSSSYIENDGSLSVEKIIRKFQDFMKEKYSSKDIDFVERNGRLLFMAFVRPIINGNGFDFKEVQISEEKRLDMVITFQNKKYIIELKIWRGEVYHQTGIEQLGNYLDRQNLNCGYLLIFDPRKQSGQAGEYNELRIGDKTIFTAWV